MEERIEQLEEQVNNLEERLTFANGEIGNLLQRIKRLEVRVEQG